MENIHTEGVPKELQNSLEWAQDGAGQKSEEGTAEITCNRLIPPHHPNPATMQERSVTSQG